MFPQRRAGKVPKSTHRVRLKIVKCCGTKRCNDYYSLRHKNFSAEKVFNQIQYAKNLHCFIFALKFNEPTWTLNPSPPKLNQATKMSTLMTQSIAEAEITDTIPAETTPSEETTLECEFLCAKIN
jgi:hypothetical protein